MQRIMDLAFAFWGSKALLAALKLDVFTVLDHRSLPAAAIQERIGLHPRAAVDFLDALVALGLLERVGGEYRDAVQAEMYLSRLSPSYVGGMLEMLNDRLYPYWGRLEEALQTGQPQNEMRTGASFFLGLYRDPERLEQFLRAMHGLSYTASQAIVDNFDFSPYHSFCDLGGGPGSLCIEVARAWPELRVINFEQPAVEPVCRQVLEECRLADRVEFMAGDFFEGELPRVDVLSMGHILHAWGLADRLRLLERVHEAVLPGGSLIVKEWLIDDDRSAAAPALLMSLNMLIETEAGANFTGQDLCGWMEQVGFRETRVQHLVGPDWMVVGRK